MKAHEKKSRIDDAVELLSEAYDADEALWSARMTGQDTEEAENSGYLGGYRDALAAVQLLMYHDDPSTLDGWTTHLRSEVPDWKQEAEEREAELCACGRQLDASGEHAGGYGATCG